MQNQSVKLKSFQLLAIVFGFELCILSSGGSAGGLVFAGELPTEKFYTNSVGMKLVRIEPGTFTMGLGRLGQQNRGYAVPNPRFC